MIQFDSLKELCFVTKKLAYPVTSFFLLIYCSYRHLAVNVSSVFIAFVIHM